MACSSDYLEANRYEQAISQVACLLGELDGVKWRPDWWRGYHPDVYCKVDRFLGDEMVSKLCKALRERDVTQYSLEMQLWWRDHQEADRQREQGNGEPKD